MKAMHKLFRSVASATLLAAAGSWTNPALAADVPGNHGVDAVVARHVAAFLRHDWDAAILDYADDAVFVLPTGPIEGKPAIMAFFHAMDAQRPVLAATKASTVGDVGLVDWTIDAGRPGALAGRDVLVIRGGKISVQTTIGAGPVKQ
jgi:ketosteroid isomerase-like protein